MSRVSRSVRFTAQPGKGAELAQLLLPRPRAAPPGCDVYLVNHDAADPDVVLVWEVWADAKAMAAALEVPEVRERIDAVKGLLAGVPEAFGAVPVGGIGLDR